MKKMISAILFVPCCFLTLFAFQGFSEIADAGHITSHQLKSPHQKTFVAKEHVSADPSQKRINLKHVC